MCSKAAENDILEWGGGEGSWWGGGSEAIFNQDSMKTAVIIPASHKRRSEETSVAFVIKSDFCQPNSSSIN